MGILENSTKEMKQFFDILAIETNYPILVHCSAGKDRTGLTMALTQELLNVPRTEIIQSYSESFKLLEKDHQRLKTEIEKSGLKPEFIDSDPSTLINTFRFLDEKFHSIRDYLESIDVNVEQQQKIIKILKE
jgi:protein-tyrosine phosphatase